MTEFFKSSKQIKNVIDIYKANFLVDFFLHFPSYQLFYAYWLCSVWKYSFEHLAGHDGLTTEILIFLVLNNHVLTDHDKRVKGNVRLLYEYAHFPVGVISCD